MRHDRRRDPACGGGAVTEVTDVAELPPAEVEEPWRRLSIRMLAVHPVMELIRFIPAIVVLIVVGTSSGRGDGGWWGLIGLGIGVVIGLLRWATTRYRVTDSQVAVRRGL